jgi:hypothetical protein
MPKRINLTLSDEAAAILQGVPYHSRGAFVSTLIEAAGPRPSIERPHCRCGQELSQRLYFEQGVWATDEADLAAYRAHQQPQHDVVAGTGKRLRLGTHTQE